MAAVKRFIVDIGQQWKLLHKDYINREIIRH